MDIDQYPVDRHVYEWLLSIRDDKQAIPWHLCQGWHDETLPFLGVVLKHNRTYQTRYHEEVKQMYSALQQPPNSGHTGKPPDEPLPREEYTIPSILRNQPSREASFYIKADTERLQQLSILEMSKGIYHLFPYNKDWSYDHQRMILRHGLEEAACAIARAFLIATPGVSRVLPVKIGQNESAGKMERAPFYALYVESTGREPTIIPLVLHTTTGGPCPVSFSGSHITTNSWGMPTPGVERGRGVQSEQISEIRAKFHGCPMILISDCEFLDHSESHTGPSHHDSKLNIFWIRRYKQEWALRLSFDSNHDHVLPTWHTPMYYHFQKHGSKTISPDL